MAELGFEKTVVGYNSKVLISDISFEVNGGEIVALAGPNGAGKSTILKTAAGLLKPLGGKVLLREKDITEYSLAQRSKLMSVMMTQRVATEYLSCFDVVRTGRYQYTDILGNLSEKDRQIIQSSMELIGVWDLKDRDFSKLSDGQKQRVLLAGAIVSEPSLLILDEPTSFLDMGYKTEFFDVLKMLAGEKKVAVLISMHELELVKKVADKVICISRDNRIDRCGAPADILTPEYVEQLFNMKEGKYGEYYG